MKELVTIIDTLQQVRTDIEVVLNPQPIHQQRTYQLEEALRLTDTVIAILRGVSE
jgi:hypothetical protein